jgi:leucyl/phenylalanyl-tRNA--protein transferase
VHILNQTIDFPPVEMADEQGLLAAGGDLSMDRLINAYRHGIFPWYNEDEPILWWSPNPRCVLFPEKLKISKSMQQLIKSKKFTFKMNKACKEVISFCKNTNRKDGAGSWINEDIIDAYTKLHQAEYVISGEAYLKGKMVGGLYGVRIGNVFFGESMFTHESNASKFAFIQLVIALRSEGLKIIDCQMETAHLISLGAEMIDRKMFVELLNIHCEG